MSIDVSHLSAGDYIEAEFQELAPRRRIDGEWLAGRPTGRTYILKGRLWEHESVVFPGEKILAMPNRQCVRQIDGTPGNWLIRIIKHKHGGKA